MTENLFKTGIARRDVNPRRRADAIEAYKSIDTLRYRRDNCLTTDEYKALTVQINNLHSGILTLLDNQTELF